MEHQLTIYNTLNRKKELFVPLHAPHVGMYLLKQRTLLKSVLRNLRLLASQTARSL